MTEPLDDQYIAQSRTVMSDPQKVERLRKAVETLDELRITLVAEKKLGRNRYIKAMQRIAADVLRDTQ